MPQKRDSADASFVVLPVPRASHTQDHNNSSLDSRSAADAEQSRWRLVVTPGEELLLVMPITVPRPQPKPVEYFRANGFPSDYRQRLEKVALEDEDPRRRTDAEILLLFVNTLSIQHVVEVTGCHRGHVTYLLRELSTHGIAFVESKGYGSRFETRPS